MRALVEIEYPNTEKDVCVIHIVRRRWSMHAIDITILQMRGHCGPMHIALAPVSIQVPGPLYIPPADY